MGYGKVGCWDTPAVHTHTHAHAQPHPHPQTLTCRVAAVALPHAHGEPAHEAEGQLGPTLPARVTRLAGERQKQVLVHGGQLKELRAV